MTALVLARFPEKRSRTLCNLREEEEQQPQEKEEGEVHEGVHQTVGFVLVVKFFQVFHGSQELKKRFQDF
ncbi:hypothetical protein TH61_06645 [Rufibacter sp. DG15C]|nr:hypothetical protein TH61_06645 [Rufibacter sp. DG15C]